MAGASTRSAWLSEAPWGAVGGGGQQQVLQDPVNGLQGNQTCHGAKSGISTTQTNVCTDV